MRYLTACGLAAAAFLMCDLTAHAQAMRTGGGSSLGGSSLGSSSSGFGGGGGLGGGSSLGSSSGFGNGGNGQFSFSGGTSFVGSSSQSFAGGSGGTSFTGSGGGSFTGGSNSFTGSNGTGGYGIGGGGGFRGGSVSTGVSTMNPFRSTFGNPLAPGLISGASNAAFGQALYSNLSPTSTNLLGGTTSGMGGLGGTARIGGGTTGSAGQTGGNYGAFGIANRNSVVVALPGGFVPAGPGPVLASPGAAAVGQAPQLSALPASMQANLRNLLSRSSVSPATQSAVTFGLDGNTVVLRGTAASAADAREIENLIRFAPRVGGVRNEMTWK